MLRCHVLLSAETMLNAVTEMQQDFPQRKVQFDAELGELDSQLNALNNLLGRWVPALQRVLLTVVLFVVFLCSDFTLCALEAATALNICAALSLELASSWQLYHPARALWKSSTAADDCCAVRCPVQ